MKKLIGIMIFVIAITFMVACSNEQKTKEEIKKEVLAELEEEKEAAEKELASLDIRDQDAIYEFIEDQYPGVYTREDFSVWEPTYLDLNGDGNDEVVYTAPYGEGNLDNILFMTGDNGHFDVIPSSIPLEKYEDKVDLDGDFITITQASGGSGIRLEWMGIYKYDGMEIVHTGVDLIMEDIFSMPDGYEITGDIEGDLNDFVHTLTRKDLATDKISVIEKTRYIYLEDNINYDMEYLVKPKKESNDSNGEAIELSLKMTKEDIFALLGNEYETYTTFNDMDGVNVTSLDYSDIVFEFFHDSNDIPPDTIPTNIIINSNRYKYNYDVKIGDSALEAIAKCEQSLENLINPHGFEDEELPDWFLYKEDTELYNMLNGDYILTFEYDSGERYFDKNEIPKDVKVASIKLLGYYN